MGGLLFNRNQRIFFVKLIALLSIVRWYNIAITAIAQYLTALFVFNPGVPAMDVLRSRDLHLLVLVTALVVAAGYIINSFYDLEKDMVNRPDQTIFGRLVSKSFCLYCYFTFNLIALIIAIGISFNVLVYFGLFTAALWAYSHKLQRYPVLREISASLLSVASVLSVGLYYQFISTQLLLYAIMVMLVLFNKELIKDIVNQKGDELYDYETITVRFGSRVAFYWLCGFSVIGIAIASYFIKIHSELIFELSMFGAILLMVWTIALLYEIDKTTLRTAHILYKILIVLMLASLVYL